VSPYSHLLQGLRPTNVLVVEALLRLIYKMSQRQNQSPATLMQDVPVLSTQKRAAYQHFLKRGLDLFGSSVLLCLLSPVFLVVTLLVWISDGVPVFYARRVVGCRGEFNAYKFRSMLRNADAILAADPELRDTFTRDFKLKSDPRVTRLGAWLRKYSLDELPQLVNVLRGQMSLVGPRMISAEELSKYGQYQELLIGVKPGLTGYWQVRGRQDVSYEQRVQMDVQYITQWSLALDLLILFETPLRVIRGEGAY
jgi:lipopolysaccharide/colanic/teichoic acid biosynthesis glycosyltransferase